MRRLLVQASLALFLCSSALGLKVEDLAGTWDVRSEGEIEEGVGHQIRERVAYGKDGSFLSSGGVFMSLKENGTRIMTVGGEDRGTFEIKDDKLHVKTAKMEVDFFASLIPEVSRETFDESIEEILAEEVVYTIVSVAENKIVIKDDDDGMESVMTRFVNQPEAKALEDDPTRRKGVKEDSFGKRYRWFSRSLLEIEGFKAAEGLPTWKERSGVESELRSKQEILDRLMCCNLAVVWASTPEESVPSAHLQGLIENRGLKEHLTDKEKEILGTDRKEAGEKFQASVGWQIESMWALAWVLGFEETPDVDQDQVGEETISALFRFLAPVWADKDAFLKKLELKELNEVVQMEDLFYCAHNAVRSAQTGKENCVPEGFHPVRHGGIIHEKRHALTWVLSPGVDWEDTDLST